MVFDLLFACVSCLVWDLVACLVFDGCVVYCYDCVCFDVTIIAVVDACGGYGVCGWVGGFGLSGYAMIPSVLLPVYVVWWCFVDW